MSAGEKDFEGQLEVDARVNAARAMGAYDMCRALLADPGFDGAQRRILERVAQDQREQAENQGLTGVFEGDPLPLGLPLRDRDMDLPDGCLRGCDWRGGPIHAKGCPNAHKDAA